MSRRSISFSYRPLLRRALVLAAVSLGLALALVVFLFGASDAFFSRLLDAFFVFFSLLAATFLGVVPFVSWAATHWFGRGWTGAGARLSSRPTAAAPAATVRKPARTVSSGSNS